MIDTGIYVHIPFCAKKCRYCDFLSSPANDTVINKYIHALLNEIKMYSKIEKKDREIKTIYIGGGTPSFIRPEYIREIISTIMGYFKVSTDAEITIEVNPGTVNREKFEMYKNVGINRLSMGLQSADNDELALLGRIHTYEEFENNYYEARKAGLTNISVDIMSAIPKQTLESYINTLNKIIALNPEHISSYSLIVEENTDFYKNKDNLNLVNEDTEREMYYITNDILSSNGYNRYEISNYAKEGYESKHNSAYWILRPYYGFGLGASSYIDNVRYKNISNINEYTELLKNYDLGNDETCTDKLTMDIEEIDEAEQMNEFIILGLRMINGISRNEFRRRFGVELDEIYGDAIRKYTELNMLVSHEDNLRFSDKGLDVSNVILAEFYH